jgi:hypothetical protein
VAGQVGTTAARDHRAHPVAEPGGGDERRRRAGAGAEQAERKTAHRRLLREPAHDVNKPLRQKRNIEDIGAIGFLLHGQQVEQQGRDAARVQRLGDGRVARTEAAGAAAVREHDEGVGSRWKA